jgi:phage terminase small subunit
MRTSQKQEKFALNLFSGMSQREAYKKAGYSTNFAVAIVDSNACRLAKSNKVLARLKELNAKAENGRIMSVLERKERLSEIARTNLTQFMELGQDGSWVNLGAETPNTAAIQEIHSRTEYDDNGSKPTVYTSIKLHDPLKAIDLLNKMDGAYAPIKTDVTSKGEAIKTQVFEFSLNFDGNTNRNNIQVHSPLAVREAVAGVLQSGQVFDNGSLDQKREDNRGHSLADGTGDAGQAGTKLLVGSSSLPASKDSVP